MTTLYVVMVADRHYDPTPFPFTDRERAIEEARAHLADHLQPDDVNDPELGEQPSNEWLFLGHWSHEGDSVWVVEVEVDGPVTLA